MKTAKWQYRLEPLPAPSLESVVRVDVPGPDRTIQERLNELGEDGWELVSVTGGSAYLKRPKGK